MTRFLEIIKAIFECFFIGFVIKYSLVFGLEARLEDFFLNVAGYYMISGLLATYAVWQIRDSEVYNFLKERKSASINSESSGDSC